MYVCNMRLVDLLTVACVSVRLYLCLSMCICLTTKTRHSWLAEHKPIVLCGPPGSGKTMTLFSALRSLPDMEVCHFLYL